MLFEEQKEKAQHLFENNFGDFNATIEPHWTMRHLDSSKIFVEAHIQMFVDSHHQAFQVTTLRDITKEHLLLEEKAQQEAMLIQQSKMAMVGEMISNIAHQWRQPLNVVSLLTANLKDAYEFNELDAHVMEEFSQQLSEQVQFMSHTIDDFRNFFQPIQQKEHFCPMIVIKDTMNMVSPQFKAADIHCDIACECFRFDVNKQHCSSFYVYKNALSQTVLNILNNAKDAIIENTIPKGKITISQLTDAHSVQLSFCDNGGGIPPHILPNIFAPYFTTKGSKTGTGIGLYMSKMLVEKHLNGTIEAFNTTDGACFSIRIPVSSTTCENNATPLQHL